MDTHRPIFGNGHVKISRIAIITLLISMIAISTLFASNSLFKVISQGDEYTEVEFNLSDYTVVPVEVDGIKYNRLYHSEAGFLMDEKLPEVIHFSFFLQVPRTGGVEIEQPLIHKSEVVKDFNLFPSQGYDLEICEEKGFVIDEDFYQKDISYPEKLVQLGQPGIMRDTRLVNVTLYPFAYNPATDELTVRENMTVRINYDQSVRGEDELRSPERRISRGFENVKRGIVLNYGQFRNPNLEYQPRSILIIRHRSDTINSLVDQIAGWKRDKGFEVTVTTTANMSTDHAIRNYIQGAYNNWNIPPEYVMLIGDGGDGGLTIPFNTSQNDHYYSLLAGNNDYSDVFVGRLSVRNAEQLATAWNKMRNFERTPFMQNTEWYNRAALMGDLGSHGGTISPLFLMKHLKQIMLQHQPNKDIIELSGQINVNQMTNAMNQGGLFFWYRGRIGASGWPPSETSMTNGYMLPHANFVTCSTLDYQGGRQAEPTFRAGTPTTPRGAITVVGFRGGANTGPGNAMTAGTLTGIYSRRIRVIGEAMVYSKMNLWRVYGNAHPNQASQHSRNSNLIGDPSLDVWTAVPKELNAEYPETLPKGSNSVEIIVTDVDDNPVEDAWVTIRQMDEDGDELFFATGYTGPDGISTRYFPDDTEGEITVTVTKHDYKAYLGEIDVSETPGVTYNDIVINDDLNAGSQVDFVLSLRNHSDQAVNGINGTISTTSEYVNITENSSGFGNIAAGQATASNSEYSIEILNDAPDGHIAVFKLDATDGNNNWISRFNLVMNNGHLSPVSMDIIDDGGTGTLDPLDEADLRFHIRNNGEFELRNVRGRYSGEAYGVSIVDSTAFFGDIAPGQTVSSTNDHIRVSTSTYVIDGQIFDMQLELFNDEGFSQTHSVQLEIGEVTVTSPLGPDRYGYWIYDHEDVGYVDTPEYDWIEIADGNDGFQGNELDIDSDYDNIQEHTVVDLPFDFTFYGIEYDRITVSTNGWISFGDSEMAEQRNWRLPGVLGPVSMVAAFWDNLSPRSGGIFYYHWEERNKFIIQWENNTNVMNNAPNTFQIILYDPSAYYTTTFDGPIKIQYKVFNNVNNGANSPGGIGNWGTYCTVGIRNHLNDDGLEYTFNNSYPTAARPITNETALYITTGLSSALVGIESYSFAGETTNQPNYDEVVDINMRLQNVGIEEAFDVEARLETEDPYIEIVQARADYGDMDVQQSVELNNAFTVRIADDVPHNHSPTFRLVVTAADNLFWSYYFSFRVQAPSLITLSPFIHDPDGNNNGLIDPGEDVIMYVPVHNEGATTPPVNVTIESLSDLAEVTSVQDPEFYFVAGQETQYAAANVSISNQAETGSGLRFRYHYETGNYDFEGEFLVGVGGIIPVTMGEGDEVPGTNDAGPLNIYFRSNRSQFVYTAEEFNTEGIYGEFPITQFGFFVEGEPDHNLTDFTIKLAHTTQTDVTQHFSDSLTTVFSHASYSPSAGEWDMLTFDEPFVWNGQDNLIVDTSFDPVASWSATGQIRVYERENGYRFIRDDESVVNQTTNRVNSNKPQAMLMMGVDPEATANRPQNLAANSSTSSINLEWDPPENRSSDRTRRKDDGRTTPETRNTRYNVYRNGVLLNEEPLNVTAYQDNDVEGHKMYHYYVTSIIDGAESNPSNVVSIEVNAVSMPAMAPPPGVYTEPITISLSVDTPESVIYYTLDGSEPDQESTLYDEPFEIDYHTEVRARGFRGEWLDSRIASGQYYILYAPQDIAGEGTFDSITLTWDDPWAPERSDMFASNRRSRRTDMRDQLNSRSEPIGFNVYKSEDEEEFVKMNEELIEDYEYSEEDLDLGVYHYYVTAVYEQGESGPSFVMPVGVGVVTKPAFSHEPGEYKGFIELELITYTPGSVIYYTLDGTDPDETSRHYREPILLETTTEVKAFSVRTDWQDSETTRGVFEIIETSVEEEEEAVPIAETELMAAYPNPFNPSTTIAFNLKQDDEVSIEVYDIRGRKVTTLMQDYMQAGNHRVVWHGIDDRGSRVSSGIYFYRMQTSDYSNVRKIVMIK